MLLESHEVEESNKDNLTKIHKSGELLEDLLFGIRLKCFVHLHNYFPEAINSTFLEPGMGLENGDEIYCGRGLLMDCLQTMKALFPWDSKTDLIRISPERNERIVLYRRSELKSKENGSINPAEGPLTKLNLIAIEFGSNLEIRNENGISEVYLYLPGPGIAL